LNNNTNTIKAIQGLLGVTQDGIFGPKSRAALEALIRPPTEGTYSKPFTDFWPWLMEWEGTVYENDPDDPGGATKYGIDQRSHPTVNIRNLTEDGAMAIYWRDYWLKAGCDKLDSPYAEVMFNCAVNMGVGRAKEFDLVAKDDPKTFLALQEAKYRSIAANNPVMQKYLKGWLNRTESLRERFHI
jgi:lysozyme family protein